jgi:thiol:disulfide interchange protein
LEKGVKKMFKNIFHILKAAKWNMFTAALFLLFVAGYSFGAIEKSVSGNTWSGATGIFFAYITGLLMSFTPCVWPIYPITSSVILNSSSIKTKKMALLLSTVYVLGLVVTYSVIGAVTGKMGALVSNYLKSVWLVSALSLVLIVFGLSMLGLFQIRMPSTLSVKVFRGKQRGFAGVFVMGLLSGLVLTPCITPVVGALVAFVIKSGSWMTGAGYFFAFALGMGTILIAIGTLSGALNTLPKPGQWMLHVKHAFGVIMIGVALYLAWPVVAPAIKDKTGTGETPVPADLQEKAAEQKKIEWITDLQKGLELAKSQNKPALIDFYAEWCGYCKLMDKNTFSDEKVIEESKRFVMIKFDATKPTSKAQEILEDYQVTGFPSFAIIDTKGERHSLRGYVKTAEFLDFTKKAVPAEQLASPAEKPSSPVEGLKPTQTDEARNEITWIHNFDEGIALAKAQKKPVMIDFYADWCYYCKEMDKKVFPDQAVIKKSSDFVMIKYDATRTTPEVRAKLKEYEITGFPTTIFIDTKGEVYSLVGYVPANEFVEFMNKIH